MTRLHIIDDDEMTCMTLERLAEQMGHQGASSTSLKEGIRRVREEKPALLFLDVNLPDGNGLDALPALRDLDPSPIIIIVTAMGDAESAELAIHGGAWDYAQKPLSLPQLRSSVERALRFRERSDKQDTRRLLEREGIIGSSARIQECVKLMGKAAVSELPCLITGQTGTGKELFARAIHENSRRSKGPFVTVDCASLPANLAESTLFGHRRGAFTGADAMREGLVAQAHTGSLFLDEIGEMPLDVQRVLLRVLQEKRFRPVGGDVEQQSNFRLIAATNRDLLQEVSEGRFREDLYYRIRGFIIELPPLAERDGDIALLAAFFADRLAGGPGRVTLSNEYTEMLARYDWPGNVRELALAVERSMAGAEDSQELLPEHLPVEIRANVTGARMRPANERGRSPDALKDFKTYRDEQTLSMEREYLMKLKEAAQGDPAEARRISGLSKSRMYALLKKHGLSLS